MAPRVSVCWSQRNWFSRLILFIAARRFTSMASTMKAAVADEFGGPEKLQIKEVARPVLGNSHIFIKVAATAVNRADTLQRKGLYPPPKGESEIIGLEVSGEVEDVGKGTTKGFRKGDKVMALLAGGGYAEYVSVDESLVMRAPTGMDLTQAAAIPEVWLTAYQLLNSVGKVQEGENVLIHAGGSGVGTAAVQLTKLAKAKAFVTAGSTSKLEKAKELGASIVANYKEEDFSEVCLKESEGKGINLILDPVGASFWEKNMKCLATDGRWVLYGLLGGRQIEGNLFGQLLGKRGQLMATTLRTRSLSYKKELVDAFTTDVLPHFDSGTLTPIVDTVFPFEKVSDAHTRMEASHNIGKIVIQVQKESGKDEL